jgi:hypothetical protein
LFLDIIAFESRTNSQRMSESTATASTPVPAPAPTPLSAPKLNAGAREFVPKLNAVSNFNVDTVVPSV